MRRAVLAILAVGVMLAATSTSAAPDTSGAVMFPAGFGSDIYVGDEMVYSPGAPTTTTEAPSTTEAATTTVAPSTTATTTAPTTTVPGAPGCGLPAAAFCETFDAPAGNGGKTGDLDPVLWGVSRVGDVNPGQGVLNDIPFTAMSGCGSSASTAAPGDVRICNGQMFETVNDGGGVTSIHTYPKQPFNFYGRTGRVVFDVSADGQGSHAAWPEFAITDKPVPGVSSMIGDTPAGARNSVGFSIAGCGFGGPSQGVDTIFTTKGFTYNEHSFTTVNCFTAGSSAAMNHIEVRVSVDRLEVWGTDAGSSSLKLLVYADNLNLTLTQGLVWMNDVHYNAHKGGEGTQANHTFAWDNLGFDGPKTYRDLGFDTPDNDRIGGRSNDGSPTKGIGYTANGLTLTVAGVNSVQQATSALVVLNHYAFAQAIPDVSINGGPWISSPWPYDDHAYSWRSIAIPVPLAQIHDGANTISFRGEWSIVVANVTLILVAGAQVP